MCDTTASLKGKVAIVTGGSAGIGLGAAENLARLGARVIIASRNEDKLKKARDSIEALTGNSDIAYRQLDLASLKSIRSFASETLSSEPRLDILVNNAGAVALPDTLTEDGLNLTLQVNYFGAFLLTFLLIPMLKASAPSRIINSSASSMYIGELDFDHWNDVGRYNIITSVANSKLADALFTAELDRRLAGTGVTANDFDPFIVRGTDLFGDRSGIFRVLTEFYNTYGLPKEEVGRHVAFLAADSSLKGISGQNFKFCRPWLNHWLIRDVELTRRLWEESKKAVKISDDEDWETHNRGVEKAKSKLPIR